MESSNTSEDRQAADAVRRTRLAVEKLPQPLPFGRSRAIASFSGDPDQGPLNGARRLTPRRLNSHRSP